MALVVSGLDYGHPGGEPLYRDASFRVEAGTVVGVTGPSGSGKSTLGALLAGDLRPRAGEITVDGAPLPGRGFRPVQLIHQHPERAVNPKWRMRSVLRESHAVPRETLDLLGIRSEWLDRRPGELSGGELQRFCIARALHPATRYLVADEMTAMFDAITQARIWHALNGIVRERGLGMVVISHEPALLDRLCDERIPVERLRGPAGGARRSRWSPAARDAAGSA
ncbi:ATP-binding cassette domain-containing protein [Planomonospora sp. ID91781]|uniref:ABC transporter ATP-binding protein n=1 Tax=Planomonospora sp. ID91781 TaxID=2738135 RepID=UPI0018C43216|nr:ATP-binding cassette domain-containing protein [Planomonospora sp. ID91781]MBG0822519.1 ATP-binding cassette domain-containing protein [Planomonospora sp. ID91781]